MKKFIPLLMVIFVFTACDLFEKATTIDIDSTLKFTIPVSSSPVTKSASESATYNFEGSDILSLAEDNDVADYIQLIKSIESNGSAYLVFSGMTSGNTISSISFVWGYSTTENGSYTMSSEITLSNPDVNESQNTVSFTLDETIPEILNFIESHPDYYYKATVSGKSTTPINTSALLSAPVKIEASPL